MELTVCHFFSHVVSISFFIFDSRRLRDVNESESFEPCCKRIDGVSAGLHSTLDGTPFAFGSALEQLLQATLKLLICSISKLRLGVFEFVEESEAVLSRSSSKDWELSLEGRIRYGILDSRKEVFCLSVEGRNGIASRSIPWSVSMGFASFLCTGGSSLHGELLHVISQDPDSRV